MHAYETINTTKLVRCGSIRQACPNETTLNPKPETLNPKTPNPKHKTRNPKPQTLKPPQSPKHRKLGVVSSRVEAQGSIASLVRCFGV